MIFFERSSKRSNVVNNVCSLFSRPAYQTARVADYWFIQPFRLAYDRKAYCPLLAMSVLWPLWLQMGIILVAITFPVMLLGSLIKLGWSVLDCLLSEVCSGDPFSCAYSCFDNHRVF